MGVMPNIPMHNFPQLDSRGKPIGRAFLGTTVAEKINGSSPQLDTQYHYSIVTYGSFSGGNINTTPPSFLTATKDMETSLHEVGHQHGTMHTGAGGSSTPDPYFTAHGVEIGVPGWNRDTGIKIPKGTLDIMGYSTGPEWPSDHTFCIWYQHEFDVTQDYTKNIFLH